MKILTACFTGLLLLIAAATPALAEQVTEKLCPDPLFGGPDLDQWEGDEILEQLALDATHQQRIDRIKETHELSRAKNHARLAELTELVSALDPADAGFEEAITAIATERAHLVGDQVRQRILMVAEIQAVLSPTQRQTLERMMTNKQRQRTLVGQP